MEQAELTQLLDGLIATWETEVVEFKQANDNYSTDDIGRYFSALANEANLRGARVGWLVFGVHNKTRRVVGTDYRPQAERLQQLKIQITENAEPRISFRDIHELAHADGRVLLLEVPAAPLGIPIAWKGHYYARAGESLTSLSLDKLDAIRRQTLATDWSAQVVPGATLDDLDIAALRKARESFSRKYANRVTLEEVLRWPAETFLDRARVTQDGRITRATLLLLGKAESGYRLSPHPAQLTWSLVGPERAYEHFAPPFLLSTTRLYQRIRNIQLRILPQDELVPVEVPKYDQRIVLEALHNCIAHQDYRRNARVVVIEQPDKLIFENEGDFFEGLPDDYVRNTRPPHRYRNPFLAQAMSELNMIDTMGYGIHDMYSGQARRYFPLPDYDLNRPGAVSMTIYGGVVDLAYSRMLIQRTDLALADVLALDRVQKKLPIPTATARHLRKAGLIEGRRPNYFVAAGVVAVAGDKAAYIRNRPLNDDYLAKLLTDYLEQFQRATRAEINGLLLDKLGDVLTDQQKYNKVSNLISKLRRRGVITNTGSDAAPSWHLVRKN